MKSSKWRPAAWLAAAALAHTSAQAQNVIAAEALSGQPLQYMRDGAVSGCGIRVIAGRRLGNGIEFSEVSVNVYSSGAAVVKAVAYKPASPAQMNGAGPQKAKVAGAWIKPMGRPATKVLSKPSIGEDSASLLYATDLDSSLSVVAAIEEGVPIQMAVRRAGAGTEVVLTGTVVLEEHDRLQLANCFSELGGNKPSK